jgi:hypothetical protein
MLTALQPEFYNQLPNDWSMMQKHHPARNKAARTSERFSQSVTVRRFDVFRQTCQQFRDRSHEALPWGFALVAFGGSRA